MIQAPAGKTYLKILAFCAAVVVWFVVITVENHVSVLAEPVPVKVENLDKSLSLSGGLPKAKLYLGVDKSTGGTLSASDFEVLADLSDLGAGDHTVKLFARSKNDKVQVLKIEPSELNLKLSPAVEKEVGVQVKVRGEPAQEHVVESTLADTGTVKIRGAQSVIDRVGYVEAELVLDGTQKEETSQTVSLKVPAEADIERNLLVIDPEQIVVTAAISTELKQKEVGVVAGFTSEDERTAWEKRITINPGKVTIQGADEDIGGLLSVQTLPIEISSLNRNGFVNIGLQLPEGVETVMEGQQINVSLTQKTAEKSIDVPVSVKVKGQLTDVTVSPANVRVTLRGPQDILEGLGSDDIIAVIKRDSAVTADESTELPESDISVPVGLSVAGYSPHIFMLLQPDTI